MPGIPLFDGIPSVRTIQRAWLLIGEGHQPHQSGGHLRCHGGCLIDSSALLLLRLAEHSQVRAYPLRAWLPDVEPSADRAGRGHPPGRYLTREFLGSLHLQRVITRSTGCSQADRRARMHLARADAHQKSEKCQAHGRPRSIDYGNQTPGPSSRQGATDVNQAAYRHVPLVSQHATEEPPLAAGPDGTSR